MSDRTRIDVVRAAAALGGLLAVSGSVMLLVNGQTAYWVNEGGPLVVIFAVFFAVLLWLMAPRQPDNAVLWVMVVSSVSFGVFIAAGAGAASLVPVDLLEAETTSPADLPTVAAWLMALHTVGWAPGVFSLTTLGLILFPDGSLPSPRWKGVAVLGAAVISAVPLAVWQYRPGASVLYHADLGDDPLTFFLTVMALFASVLSAAGLIWRFRRRAGRARDQFKWVAWGASIFVLALVVAFPLEGSHNTDLAFYLGGIALVGSYGIAVARHRLFDIDVVISRTFVYGTLAVFISVVYVAAVVGIGQLIGSGDRPNPVLAIAATTVVALAFQPLRRLLQSMANRLVYGRRATPYEVLSTFSQRVAAVDPDVLTQIAEALVEGTTGDAAGVWMKRGADMQLIAQWPADIALPKRVSPEEVSGFEQVASVTHNGEQLGLVSLGLRPGQAFSPVDAQLLDQVAAGLGLALRNLKLTEDLRDRLDQLRDSRRRIVAVQDATRRRLERDLHDGAQQRLVSLKIKLGIGLSMATKDGLDDVRQVLDRLRTEADETIEAVRDFARGIYPPLLEAEGLGPALSSRANKLSVPVTVQAAGVGRHPREVEATVYFCVLECLQNAAKHARAGSVLVVLDDLGDALRFEVRDDGVGFDVEETPRGSGLTHMADRLDALDGTLEVISAPRQGTTIRGAVPSMAAEPVP